MPMTDARPVRAADAAFIVGVVLGVMSGCAVGPEYQETPPAPDAKRYTPGPAAVTRIAAPAAGSAAGVQVLHYGAGPRQEWWHDLVPRNSTVPYRKPWSTTRV